MVALLQAHPESLLAKLVDAEGETDGVMVENAGGEPMTIRIDRDPALFAHVLKLFDTPLPAEDTEKLHEELDFYGMLPACAMLPASTIAHLQSGLEERFTARVVSSIVNQMAKLMKKKLHGLDEKRYSEALERRRSNIAAVKELTFYLKQPKGTERLSEMLVLCSEDWTAEDTPAIKELSSYNQQALQTRLRSLGYGVTISRCKRFNLNGYNWVGEITVSWADK